MVLSVVQDMKSDANPLHSKEKKKEKKRKKDLYILLQE